VTVQIDEWPEVQKLVQQVCELTRKKGLTERKFELLWAAVTDCLSNCEVDKGKMLSKLYDATTQVLEMTEANNEDLPT
jgi:hypothetical protein